MDMDKARYYMVQQHVRPWNVTDTEVIKLLSATKREDFISEEFHELAYADTMLPLPLGESMLQPKVIARALQALEITKQDNILEVGTGSGYCTYLLSKLGKHVTSFEGREAIYNLALASLKKLNAENISLIKNDVLNSLNSNVKFDVIMLTGSIAFLPKKILDVASTNARIFAIIGKNNPMNATLFKKNKDVTYQISTLFETEAPSLHQFPEKSEFTF